MTADTYDPHAHARTTDPDTSHAAARSIRPGTMLRRILAAHAEAGPMTADECATFLGYDSGRAWAGERKRLSDLMNAGYLRDTETRRRGRSNRMQIVRAITEAGREALNGDH